MLRSARARRSARPGPTERVTLDRGRHAAPAVARRHVRRRHRRVRPAERPRHRARDRRDDPRGPAGREGGDPGVLAADGAGAGPALSRVLPAGPSAGRPGARPEHPGRLPLLARPACCSSPTARRCSTCWPSEDWPTFISIRSRWVSPHSTWARSRHHRKESRDSWIREPGRSC